MAIYTDLNLFTGPINIDTSSRGVESELQEYCDTIEQEVMENLLGTTLYTEYLDDKTAQKYVDLIEGVEDSFTYNGKTQKYTGLKTKFCFLIYFRYLQDQYASNTPFGDVSPSPSNGNVVVNIPRVNRAYNKYVDAFNAAVDFINYKNSEVSGTYDGFTTEKLEYINSFGI